MLQRVIPHAAGRFSRCRQCAAEPRHIDVRGRHSSEPVLIHATPARRHRLECRCGARTGLHAHLASAESEWGTDYAQLALPLRAPKRRRAA